MMSTPQIHFEILSDYVYKYAGLVLSTEKIYLMEQRLNPILTELKLESIGDLLQILQSPFHDPKVRALVIDAMTTHETSFFRDTGPFQEIAMRILPKIADHANNRPPISWQKKIRIWSAACSTGQEPFSLAMLIRDWLWSQTSTLKTEDIEIIATDISPLVLAKAASGIYSQFEVERGLKENLRDRYFDPHKEGWKVKSELLDMVKFRELNLMDDFRNLGSFDLILCRNVLIYFDRDNKSRIIQKMTDLLTDGGFLMLGGAESLLDTQTKLVSHSSPGGSYYQKNHP